MGDEGVPDPRGKAMEPVKVEAFRMTTAGEREKQRVRQQVAWIWGRYRAYRMEPGVHEKDMDEVELFLRWVERRDGGGEMTEERLKAAQSLWERIEILEGRIARGPTSVWYDVIPEEMRQRHMGEVLAWVEEELARVQAEFAEL